MKYLIIYIASLFLLGTVTSCKKDFTTIQSLMKYVNAPENGLVKHKEVGGFSIQVKNLPTDYLVYRELEDESAPTQMKVDSLRDYYASSLHFILRVGPAEDQSFDVMKGTVQNPEEYKEQSYVANFELQEYLSLKIDDNQELKPALVRMENVYGLTDHRNFNVVYSLTEEQLKNAKKIDFIYRDYLFETGKHHFLFDTKNIVQTPLLKF